MRTPAVSACLGVGDLDATLTYYENLGFAALPAPAGAYIRVLTYGGEFAFMLQQAGLLGMWLPPLKDTPTGCCGMHYLAVDDFDTWVEQHAGHVDVVKGPVDAGGHQALYFRDPNGYIIGVTQKTQH
ncbi:MULTISPECIES: VOC family protein [Streptomyces]|uniref:Glyoxalase/fosfomycin resistance/dioxygenase domain-containing protein n=1 Tax=Streptomyces luteosporeus TaxID=173856 RepID=A0ABN3TRI9_9ACTN